MLGSRAVREIIKRLVTSNYACNIATDLLKSCIKLLCGGFGVCVHLLHVMLDRRVDGGTLAFEG